MQFHAYFYRIELSWLCEWFSSWFDLECRFSWQKLIDNEQHRLNELHFELWKFIICSCISELIWIMILCFQLTDQWILADNLYISWCLSMSADFWTAASAEFLLRCHQCSFSFSCNNIALFMTVCLDWIEWKLSDDLNHFSDLNSCSSLLSVVQDLSCWIWDSWWIIILCLFMW